MGVFKMNQEERSLYGFDAKIKTTDGKYIKQFYIPQAFCYTLTSQYTKPNSQNLMIEVGDLKSIMLYPELNGLST